MNGRICQMDINHGMCINSPSINEYFSTDLAKSTFSMNDHPS